jgi:sigma-B regulation protein RsbU (phosphoserine phosphatase)
MERLSTGGLPVGLFDQESYEEAAVALEPGDIVVIYTDGITEAKARSGERFGEARLAAAIERHVGESARAIHDHLLAALSAYRRGTLQADDLTIIVLKAE